MITPTPTFEEVCVFEMRLHPMLYLDEVDVMHQLFFVDVETRTWDDGVLLRKRPVDIDEAHRVRTIAMRLTVEEYEATSGASHRSDYIHGLKRKLVAADESYDRFIDVCREMEVERRTSAARVGYGVGMWHTHPLGWSRSLYVPHRGRAQILHIPQDVQPSWLAAAERALAAIDDGRLRPAAADGWIIGSVRRLVKRRRGEKSLNEPEVTR